MADNLCKSCGKPPEGERAGSITSYFFQHNFCQCHSKRESGQAVAKKSTNASTALASTGAVCQKCGKQRSEQNRGGSFTAYLFQELRCQCRGSDSWPRTSTAVRSAQRKQFTEVLRNSSIASAVQYPEQFCSDTVIGGTFKIVSLIGEGGMGAVYLVEHIGLQRNFALKILSPRLVNEASWRRFQSEAHTLASLNHPTFVKVYDLGIHEKTIPFYSMEYLRGYSLEELIAGDGPMPLAPMLSTFLEILDGLAYAHRNGIVHRDLKPGNIMICTVDGVKTVKVLDFGISKFVGSSAGQMQDLTAVGDVFGSPFYMSPEQCIGAAVDARSDIYSLGCTMFEVLTGFVPYEGINAVDTILMHQEAEIPSVFDLSINLDLPESIDMVLAKCLAKRPEDRYQSAKELAIDLARISEGKDVQEYGSSWTAAARKKPDKAQLASESRKLPLLLQVSALISLPVLTVTAVYFLISGSQSSSDANKEELGQKGDAVSLAAKAKVRNSAVWLNYDLKQEPNGSQNDTVPFSSIESNGNQNKRVFDFPEDVTLGLLSSSVLDGLIGVGKSATGRIAFPARMEIVYTPTAILKKYPQYLRRFKPGDIAILNLDPTNSGDEMLAIVAKNAPWIPYLIFKDTSALTAKCIPSLNAFYDLRVVEASNSTIGGDILAQANCWAKLEQLHWARAVNPGPLLRKLQSSPLRVLRLEDSHLSHQDFVLISKLTGLQKLVLSGTKVTAQDCKTLSKLKSLPPVKPQD